MNESCTASVTDIPESSAPLKLTGWDHIAVVVPDLVAAEQWYVDVLGAEVVGRYNWGGDTAHQVGPHEDPAHAIERHAERSGEG